MFAGIKSGIAALGMSLLPVLSVAAETPDGAQLFRENCSVCHGIGGRSSLKDISDPALQDAISDQGIAEQIRHGTPGRMPSFKGDFNEAEIAALVRYVRALRRRER
jgi:cytochrome c oxidase cbb3-type subunit 3